ncbi:MAG: chromosome segregation protein SMC [Acidobacteriota bacterium]|jgi:chromosome segregation protein
MAGPYRLAALRLVGFKSFADPVELRFPGAIAAIVGPNGAGKSNIADAIAWVLGEQSARLLRSQTMADVVFAGSPGRPPAGSAEVALTLKAAAGGWDEDDGTLEISRRVLRDGTADYRLGGKRVRLKDITDRLLDAGLGTRAYAIIEQGRIGQVLSARATDRRALFEEAAGISKYRLRRHEAELKLAETRANLLRINDITAEVRRSLEAARRQARRAERHRRLRQELAEVRALLFAARLHDLTAALAERQEALQAALATDAEAGAALSRAEAAALAARSELETAQAALDRRRDELARLDSTLQRGEAAEQAARRELAEASARREAALEDERRLAAVLADLSVREKSFLAGVAAAEQTSGATQEEAAQRAREAERLAVAARAAASAAEDARRRLLAAVAAAAEARNRLHRLEVEREQVAYQRQRLASEEERLRTHLAAAAAREAEAHASERSAVELLATAEEAVRSLRRDMEAEAAAITAAEGARDAAAHRRLELRHEVDHLERALAQARALPQAVARAVADEDLLGVVSDLLDPPPEIAPLLDRAWGEVLSLPVVTSRRALAGIVQHLGHDEGRIAAVIADPTLPARSSPLLERAGAAPQHAGWLSRALPRAVLAADEAEAEALARNDPDVVILLPGGARWRGATVELAGSQRPIRGVLELRSRLRGARAELELARRAEEEASAELAAARGRQAQRAAALARAEEEARRASQAHAAAAASRSELHREHVRLEKELEALRQELTRLAGEAETLDRRRGAEAGEVERLGERVRAAEAEVDSLVAAAEREREQEAVARAAAEKAAGAAELAAERVRAAQRELDHHRRELAAVTARREELRRDAEEQGGRAAAAADAIARVRGELSELLARRTVLQQEVTRLTGEVEQRRTGAAEAERAAASCRQHHLATREQVHIARVAAVEAQGALDRLHETIALTLGEGAVLPDSAPAPEQLPRLEAREREALRELEALGPVNELAVAERDELESRHAFLSEQRRDLERSLASLGETVRELDTTCAERFVATLQEVAAAFATVFAELFGGGEAQVELADPEQPLDSGVEIRVRPPGKHTQSVLLLSGGEKALAAVALLLALFRVRPAPFCVLDEVDAPLDDANVERLCRLLRDMSRDTQFVLITHNRRTMAHADVLYGVTMEEPGVSRLVSVRLEE